jgi:HK97 family phage major capsid protein
MNDTLKQLHAARMRAWEAAKEILDRAEAEDRAMSAEEEQAWQKANAEVDDLDKRIRALIDREEREKAAAEAREHVERYIRPETPEEPETRQAEEDAEKAFRDMLLGKRGAVVVPLNTVRVERHADGRVEVRDLVKGTAAAGGATVPTGFVRSLYEHLVEESGIRRTGANVITTSSGEDLLWPKTTAHPTAGIVAEGGAIAEDDPTFGQVVLKAFKYGVLVQVSRELVEDTAVDLLGYIARQTGLALGRASGAHMVTGNGTSQPEGAQSSSSLTVGKQGASGQTTTVTVDDLIDLYHSLVSGYRGRGTWFMLDASLAKIRKLKDTTGQTLWQPGLQAGQPDTLLGRPVVTDPNVPAMGASVKSILFGDFGSYYTIRDVGSLRFERSDEFAFAHDLITFRAVMRVDGRVVDAGAVKAYQNAAS